MQCSTDFWFNRLNWYSEQRVRQDDRASAQLLLLVLREVCLLAIAHSAQERVKSRTTAVLGYYRKDSNFYVYRFLHASRKTWSLCLVALRVEWFEGQNLKLQSEHCTCTAHNLLWKNKTITQKMLCFSKDWCCCLIFSTWVFFFAQPWQGISLKKPFTFQNPACANNLK